MADVSGEKLQRLSDVMQMQNSEDKPELIRLGDIVGSEKVATPEIESSGFFETPTEKKTEWEALGPIGFVEQAMRQDKTEMIPFNPEGAIKSVTLLNAVNRIKRDTYTNDLGQKDNDLSLVNRFLEKSEEERIRGYSVGGRIAQGVAALPGFMIEFLTTGGVAALGKKGVKKGVEKALGKTIKNKALNFTTRVAGAGAGAVARTSVMPHRVIENFADRQITAGLELTEEGLKIAQESREKPFISFAKAFAIVTIENFSEITGPALGAIGSKIIPKRMASGMKKLWKKLHPSAALNKILVKAGYNGFIQELGEERVGALIRAVSNVESFGDEDADRMFDRIMASVPTGEELLIESAVLAFPMSMSAGAQQALKVIRGRKKEAGIPVEEPNLPEEITDKQVEEILATGQEPVVEEKKGAAKKEEGIPKFKTTGEAVAFGKENAENKQVIDKLRQDREAILKEIDILKGEKKLEEGLQKAFEGQFIREAIESAEKTLKEKEPAKKEDVKKIPKGLLSLKEKLSKAQKKIDVLNAKEVIADTKDVQIKGRLSKLDDDLKKVRKNIDELHRQRLRLNKKGVTTVALLNKINNLKKQEDSIDKEIADLLTTEKKKIFIGKKKIIIQADTLDRLAIKISQQRSKGVRAGIEAGRVFTEKEIKANQEEIIKILKESDLNAKDKAKFIQSIKNIQTALQFEKAIPVIRERISRLEIAEQVRTLTAKIKKALKPTKTKSQSGKPVGQFTPEIQEALNLMRKSMAVSTEEAAEIIAKNIRLSEGVLPDEDVRIQNEILDLFSGLDRKSPKDLQKVLDIIEEMKETGKLARFLQRFETQEDILQKKDLLVHQVTGGKGFKRGRSTLGARKTGRERFRSTMKSLGSKMILSWGGLMDTLDFNMGVEKKALQKEFSTLDQDNRYKELVEEFNIDFNEAISSSYNIDKGQGLSGAIALPFKIGSKINELQEEVNLGKFKNAEGVTVELIFTRDELIKKWMELQDPSLQESFELGNKYTPEIVAAIGKALTKQDKAFAEKQIEMYRDQWDKINPIYRDLFGVNLPFNEFYSPIKKEGFTIDTSKGFGSFIEDATTRLAITSGAFKTRTQNILPIKTQSSINVLERHMKDTGYFIAWAKQMKIFESVFKDANVREAINQEFTSTFMEAIDNSLNDFSTNGNKWARRLAPVDFFRKNFTLGKLMLKPLIMAKQLVSTLAYLEKVNPVEFTSGVIDFWKNPIKNYKILSKESVLIRTRAKNMERDIKVATESPLVKSFNSKQNFINLLMLNVATGDKMAIVMGSWALRKKRLSENMPIEDVIREYEDFSSETQQSSDISRLSEVQRGGSLETLFTMFKSSLRQYLQKELNAVKSLFQKGGTTPANLKKVARVLAIYHILLPFAFQYLANLGGWDEEDKKDYLRSGILGSFNGLFIFGDIVDSIIRKALKLRVFDNEVPVATIADAVIRAMGKIDWEDISSEEVLEAIVEFIEVGDSVGVPVTTLKNMYIGFGDIVEGDIKEGVAEILGWSPRIAKDKQKKGRPGIG